jgi:hypothetical protein
MARYDTVDTNSLGVLVLDEFIPLSPMLLVMVESELGGCGSACTLLVAPIIKAQTMLKML